MIYICNGCCIVYHAKMEFDIADVSILRSVAATTAIWLLSIGAVFVNIGPATSKYSGLSASVATLAGFVGTVGVGSGFTSARSAFVATEALLIKAAAGTRQCEIECALTHRQELITIQRCADIFTFGTEIGKLSDVLISHLDPTVVDDATEAANLWPHVLVSLLLVLWAIYGGLRWYTNRRLAWVGCALALLCSLVAGGLVYAHTAAADACALLHRSVLDRSDFQPFVSEDAGNSYLTDAIAAAAFVCPQASATVESVMFPGFVKPVYNSMDSALCTDVMDNLLVLAVVLFVASVATPMVDVALHFWRSSVEPPGTTEVPLLTF